MSDYEGVFADLLAEFVAFKRSMGFKYASEAYELHRFARLSTTFSLERPTLTDELVDAWSAIGPTAGPRTRSRRIYVLRQFALFLNTMGYEASIPIPERPTRHYTFAPYIFTTSELGRIFTAADRLMPCHRSTLPVAMPIVLRMLYGCGLRISEALNLENRHVLWESGILEISQSKFGKDRLVPMSPSLTEVCRQYAAIVHPDAVPDAYFFAHLDGRPLTRDNVYRRFREVLWQSGISHGGKGKGPRLHDLSYPNLNKIPTLAPKRCDSCQVREKRLGFSFVVCSSLSIQRRALPWMYKTYEITIPSFLPTWKTRDTQNSTWHGSPGS